MRISGLAKLVKTLKLVCSVINTFSAGIRRFVPEENLTAYDGAVSAIMSACEVILAIDYADELVNTNAPWGAQ